MEPAAWVKVGRARAARFVFASPTSTPPAANGVPILVGGEEAGADLAYGCRMGICHTCVGRLAEGQVRDLRTGEVHGEQGDMIRTCINAPEGRVEVEL